MSAEDERPVVVVGGGIAAVSAVTALAQEAPETRIVLLSGGPVVKALHNWRRDGKVLESFDVSEASAAEAFAHLPSVTVRPERVAVWDPAQRTLTTESGELCPYRHLIICTGATPKLAASHPLVLGIRDTETVREFSQRLGACRRLLVLGNGGIASEVAHALEGVSVVWAIREASIAATFVDAGAAEFFLPQLSEAKRPDDGPAKRHKYQLTAEAGPSDQGPSGDGAERALGSALGPDWSERVQLGARTPSQRRSLRIEYQAELETLEDLEKGSGDGWPLRARLSNGSSVDCDLVLSATGVRPNSALWKTACPSLALAEDGGIRVDEAFESSVAGVFAAGDVCSAGWEAAPHWLQMRLWTQARQMGHAAGLSVAARRRGHTLLQDISFDIFTHSTRFFGHKVILLGRFNSQGLGPSHEALLRVKRGEEYVKVLLDGGRVQGAVLIGETDLEETLENLILDQTDVERIKDRLLDSDIDIEDYFD